MFTATENAMRITRTYLQTIQAAPDRIFPLLCPVREFDWLDGWSCRIIHSESGFGEQGCVFATSLEGEPETIWTVALREPERGRLIFVLVTPGSRTARLDLHVSDNGDRTSSVAVEYVFTSLGPEGDAFLANSTPEVFEAKMRWWERSMNHYLATGECLRREHA